jgi:intracellular sulfur oxidation DsrE/DsrF family protein
MPNANSPSYSPRPLEPDTGLVKDILLLLGIVALFVLLWPDPASGTDAPTGQPRVVFEATHGGSDAADQLLARVEHVRRNLGDHAEIALVAYWDGARTVCEQDNRFGKRLARLADAGVDIVVCQQSLRDAEIATSNLLPFVRTVRSGAEEARRLEREGWARVRDGEAYVNPL